jgi:hypothetical protein
LERRRRGRRRTVGQAEQRGRERRRTDKKDRQTDKRTDRSASSGERERRMDTLTDGHKQAEPLKAGAVTERERERGKEKKKKKKERKIS